MWKVSVTWSARSTNWMRPGWLCFITDSWCKNSIRECLICVMSWIFRLLSSTIMTISTFLMPMYSMMCFHWIAMRTIPSFARSSVPCGKQRTVAGAYRRCFPKLQIRGNWILSSLTRLLRTHCVPPCRAIVSIPFWTTSSRACRSMLRALNCWSTKQNTADDIIIRIILSCPSCLFSARDGSGWISIL